METDLKKGGHVPGHGKKNRPGADQHESSGGEKKGGLAFKGRIKREQNSNLNIKNKKVPSSGPF